MEKPRAAWAIRRGTRPLRTVTGIFLGLVISMTFFLLLTDSNVLNFNIIGLPAVAPRGYHPLPVGVSSYSSANIVPGDLATTASSTAAKSTSGDLIKSASGVTAKSASGASATTASAASTKSASGVSAKSASGVSAKSASASSAKTTSGALATTPSVASAKSPSGAPATTPSAASAKTPSAASAKSASGASATAASVVVTTPAAGLCREGLYGMLNGHWEPKPMTAKDVEKMNAFHKHVIGYHMPKGVQRVDMRCGNYTLARGYFRALCDPDGTTPCCYENTCVNRTVEECTCPKCMDMRGGKHAEYSTWRTADPSCQPLNFTQQAMCELLDGGTVYTIGDSFVRHVHTAMVLMIRNNEETGAFSDNMPKDVQDQCRNMYMFTEKVCRLHLAMDVSACQGRVRVRHILGNYNSDGPRLLNVISELKNKSRSVVFIGLGIHGVFNSKETFNNIMKPVLERMRKENWTWPVILWVSTHSFGMLHSPMFEHQRNSEVERFNGEMAELLRPYPVYIYNAFNLTAGVTSFDGEHYGLGVNKVKINILMNFILSLKERKLW